MNQAATAAAASMGDGVPDVLSPKRIAVFCDGTWNTLRSENLTNVARLAKCVKPTGRMRIAGREHDVQQVVYYDEGVGVGEGVSPISDEVAGY